MTKIVKESSACLSGHPRTLLDADHENMCKFGDPTDVNYKRVSGVLARWTRELERAQELADEQTVYAQTSPRPQLYGYIY